jgi:hypothetical protein
MAGTMPHAIFVETGLDGGRTVAAYAAELPGCATFAATADEATSAMPRRVAAFARWLGRHGEEAPTFVGDNWYEVERAAGGAEAGDRATFSLDELAPSAVEWSRWLGWMELAREELADAVDVASDARSAGDVATAIAMQDEALAAALTGDGARANAGGSLDPIDRLYVARDRLTAALEAVGTSGSGVRRILRLAIADDLRAAERLRGQPSGGGAG